MEYVRWVIEIYSPTTRSDLHLLLYHSGGDLMLHIQREQFTPRRAKFYAAEVLLALDFLHRSGIIYRSVPCQYISP